VKCCNKINTLNKNLSLSSDDKNDDEINNEHYYKHLMMIIVHDNLLDYGSRLQAGLVQHTIHHAASAGTRIQLTLSKLVPYSITRVGHGADPGFLAVSPQVTLVIYLVVGCRYFPRGPRLLSQPKRSSP